MAEQERPDVRLVVDGQQYGGWQKVTIHRGIEQIAGTFEIEVTERWAGQDVARPIRPGAECKVTIDGEAVITGYVDEAQLRYTSSEHTVSVSGRDRTGDLVDCSAPPTQFMGRTLLQVATVLAKPFGIAVKSEVDAGGAFRSLKGEDGQTAHELLEQAAKIRAVLLLSDGLGGLVITRAGLQRVSTALVLGQNVKEGSGTFSHRDRYRDYTVKGQMGGGGLWGVEGDDASVRSQVIGRAHDAQVTRHRPLTVLADDQVDGKGARERAQWERNVRAGRAARVTYLVNGWRHAGGLWAPNRMVPVRDTYLGLNKDMLITGVAMMLDGDGVRAALTVGLREAWDLVPLPEPAAGEAAGLWG